MLDPWGLKWLVPPDQPLTGLRTRIYDSLRMPNATVVAYHHLRDSPHFRIWYVPHGPDDPNYGQPANLTAEQFVRRETRIVFLADVTGWAWVREFCTPQTRPIRRPSGRVARFDTVAYAEIDSPPDESGRWPRRSWGLCHCPSRVEGTGCCVSLPHGGKPVDPLSIAAGQPTLPPNPNFAVRGSARCAAVARRNEWLKLH